MNKQIEHLFNAAGFHKPEMERLGIEHKFEKFAKLIVAECINREELLGAIARGWCSEKNSHKEMDSDLAVAIFDEVEQQIKQKFGVE